ncbi:MAG: MBL fold metallo-hydrolase [Planctomycetota bacterium]
MISAMTTRFYHPRRQWIVGDDATGGLLMLPQFGSPSGGTHRPLNSYVVVFVSQNQRRALVFDAPFRHALPGIRGLKEEGIELVGCVLSHADLAGSGDAFDALSAEFDLPLFLHPEDRHDPRVRGVMQEWHDPTEPGAFGDLPIEVLHWPGHTPGSIMLCTNEFGGVLLTGDSAIAPGPMQPDDAPPLAIPPAPPRPFSPTDEEVCDAWSSLLKRWETDAAPRTLAPLHGEIYADTDAVPSLIQGLLQAAPMTPSVRRTA